MRSKILPFLAFITLFAALVTAVFFYKEKLNDNSVRSNNNFFYKERMHFAKRIDEIGPQAAYEEFKKDYARQDILIQHSAAHILGQLLYHTTGSRGLEICDISFISGCYHGFMGYYITEEGLDSLSLLEQQCFKKSWLNLWGCQHGIGHGIMDYLGHNKLKEALNYCKTMVHRNPLDWCSIGVFMEYNLRNLKNLMFDGRLVRPLIKDDFFEPCYSVPAEFRKSCLFEIADWWASILRTNFKKSASFCESLKAGEEREMCVLGHGRAAAIVYGFNAARLKESCDQFPHAEDSVFCRTGSAMRIFEYTKKGAASYLLCEDWMNDSQNINRDNCIKKLKFFTKNFGQDDIETY